MWFTAHPWMTLILALVALAVAEAMVSKICMAVITVWNIKERIKTLETEMEEESNDA